MITGSVVLNFWHIFKHIFSLWECVSVLAQYTVAIWQCQCQSNFFSVDKIAELLRSPQRRSRVTIQNQEMIVEKEMFLDVDGQQVGMEMTECQLAVSSIGVMQRLERNVDQRL